MAKNSNGVATTETASETVTDAAANSLGRFIVVSARVPLPLDQWEAASVMHNMAPAIASVQKTFSDALGDPEFKLSTEFVTPRVVTGAKRGRKPKADAIAAAAEAGAGTGDQSGQESAGQVSA